MSDTYNDEESMHGTSLEAEFDATFDGDERASMLLKLTSEAFSRSYKRIQIKQIGLTDPIKKGRLQTMQGLTSTVKDLGVVVPIHVMTVSEDVADDDYQYILLDGLRRMYGAMRNGQKEIDAIVWDFEDKDQGSDLALFLSLILNRGQARRWGEIWDLFKTLELQSEITPGTLEYLLQLESGDAMKLKDVMLSEYDEPKEALLANEKTLDAAYKMLQKLRKEEDKLAKEDATRLSDTVDGAEEIGGNNTDSDGELSEQDVMELLEMADDIDSIASVGEDDFADLNKVADGYTDAQKVGERHPIDPALRQAVLARDDFTCACCGMRMIGARLGLIAVHHKIPVHASGKDTLDNLITLCVGDHILLHIMERNGGSIMMSKEDFEELSENEQVSLKRALNYARVAVEADKRKGLSKKDVADYTQDAIRHPMPGAGMRENRAAYINAHNQVISSETSDSEDEE